VSKGTAPAPGVMTHTKVRAYGSVAVTGAQSSFKLIIISLKSHNGAQGGGVHEPQAPAGAMSARGV